MEWNTYIKSFENWDIYYLYEYAYSFMLHGDGQIYLICYENESERFCYVVMENDIADSPKFLNRLEKGKYFDWETPYGYGGPLANSIISEKSQAQFKEELFNYCKEKGIVSQFIRFHPLLKNYETLHYVIETKYLRDTIYIDTSAPQLILSNMDSKNRNMIRKAQKNGVVIEKKAIDNYEAFIEMYNETMKKNNAVDYYTFKKEYFDSLQSMSKNAFILYAMHSGKPISGSIIYYNNQFMHYHLSGSKMEYRKYSPSNLLLYEAALWASKNGIKQFHLGGGMAPNDSLFGFKKQFNRNGYASFMIGRTVFDTKKYNYLLKIRKELDSGFNIDNGFMIQYRG